MPRRKGEHSPTRALGRAVNAVSALSGRVHGGGNPTPNRDISHRHGGNPGATARCGTCVTAGDRQRSCVSHQKESEVCALTHRSAVPVSPAFESIARGAQFRDRIAIVVSLLVDGGALILRDASPQELITGSAAQLHRVNQAPRRFTSREAFDAFADPNHEKLFMSIRVAPTGRSDEQWLVLEHATRALSPVAERRFSWYWRVIKPLGAFVSWRLLRAIRRKAERAATATTRARSRTVRATSADKDAA